MLTLAMLSTIHFEIAVNFPTNFPERDNSFPEAKHETQFTTESQNSNKSLQITASSQFKDNRYIGDIDGTQRNATQRDVSGVGIQKGGKALDYSQDHRTSVSGHEGTKAFKANGIGSGAHTDSAFGLGCNNLDPTCYEK
jgi:hypothetical protein